MFSSFKWKVVGNKLQIKSRLFWWLCYPSCPSYPPPTFQRPRISLGADNHSMPQNSWNFEVFKELIAPQQHNTTNVCELSQIISWFSIFCPHFFFFFPVSCYACLAYRLQGRKTWYVINVTHVRHWSNFFQDSNILHLCVVGLSAHFRGLVSQDG